MRRGATPHRSTMAARLLPYRHTRCLESTVSEPSFCAPNPTVPPLAPPPGRPLVSPRLAPWLVVLGAALAAGSTAIHELALAPAWVETALAVVAALAGAAGGVGLKLPGWAASRLVVHKLAGVIALATPFIASRADSLPLGLQPYAALLVTGLGVLAGQHVPTPTLRPR